MTFKIKYSVVSEVLVSWAGAMDNSMVRPRLMDRDFSYKGVSGPISQRGMSMIYYRFSFTTALTRAYLIGFILEPGVNDFVSTPPSSGFF